MTPVLTAPTVPAPVVVAPAVVAPPVVVAPPPPSFPPPPWAAIAPQDVAGLDYRVLPDGGIVAPIAPGDDEPEDFIKVQVDRVRRDLPTWPPGADGDDVRNLPYVAAVPDTVQLPVERYLPMVVLQHLLDTFPKENLVKILTWIARHPVDGPVIDDISDLGIEGTAGDPLLVRERACFYAIKFIARLTDRKAG